MNALLTDIWPFLLTVLISTIGGYVGYIHNLKVRVAVLEKTIEDLLKTIETMQKRMDSHSEKQDDILMSINEIKTELIDRIGTMGNNLASLASDVKNLNDRLKNSAFGLKLDQQ